MATHYTLSVATLTGVTFTDTITNGLRAELASWEQQPEFNLGVRVGTAKGFADEYTSTTYYYYHNGRITVVTRRHQLTTGQRTGAVPYSSPSF